MTKHRVHLFAGCACFALLLVYPLAGIYLWAFPFGSDSNWHGSSELGEFRVTGVPPGSLATDLRPGDKIRAINGRRLTEHPEAIGDDHVLPPGSPYSMTVERDGREMTFTWRTVPHPRGSFPVNKAIPLLFWLGGLLVLLLKSEDHQAWLLALMLGTFSTMLGGSFPTTIPPNWLSIPAGAARVAGLFSLPLLLHLFLFFPQPSSWVRRWPRLTIWLYVPLFLFVLPPFGLSRLPMAWSVPLFRLPIARWLSDHGLEQLGFASMLGYLLAALLCLWKSYREADAAGRTRLRVVMWGSLIGFGSLFLIIVMEVTRTQEKLATIWSWLQFSTFFTLPLVPLSFAYAIIRHRVIPISLILRRGVRYLLVSRGSVLLALLFVGLIVATLVAVMFRFFHPSVLAVGLISAAEGIAAWNIARWAHQRYFAPVIDRWFFRQSYDAQQIVSELAASLRTTTDRSHLFELVANRLQSALQTESVTIFLRDDSTGDYFGAYGCRYNPQEGRALAVDAAVRLSRYAATLAEIARTGEPLELDGGAPEFDLARSSTLTEQERQTLRALNAALLLPLTSKDELPGFLALGSRLGDLPFSGEDKRLLQSVGAAAALALENANLMERAVAEAKRRQEIEAENEQRAKELEEARQLQLSMLPRQVPRLPQVEIAAGMRTATEVGGDYYDFHVGADGALTIAIGDATGHGLKAGTMVTVTKGLFNHLAGEPDLVATLNQTSRALKRMNLRSLFMAMTLLRLQGNRLQCTVAGMPPILIYRAAAQAVEEIPLRGAPLGGLSHYAYRQTEAFLDPGDIVLLLSDGLPERFNPAGEMFDYDRCKEFLLRNAHADPQTLIDGLLQAGEAWADGLAADDDMTFVALKMT